MPLFNKKPALRKVGETTSQNGDSNESRQQHENKTSVHDRPGDSSIGRPKLVFHCQQAQGSPTGLISGFSNVRELYQKIAECYEFPPEDFWQEQLSKKMIENGKKEKELAIAKGNVENGTAFISVVGDGGWNKRTYGHSYNSTSGVILFCTLNTHKVDMTKLLGGQIGLDDFIFVHRKGQKKEVEITKTADALGLTITDNGAGYAFIKRIKEGSVIDNIKYIQVGDHIEKINNESLVGRRHYEVAKMLKEIPRDSTFTMRLIEPLKDGFINVGPKSDSRKKQNIGSGMQTLRFRSNGQAEIQTKDDGQAGGIENINNLLENFMGINDAELAMLIWELSEGKANSMDFAEAIDNSELEEFGFTDDFIIELWGVITDARAGRLR